MLNISGQTKLAGLFAQPAEHSISPLIQTTAFSANEIDAVYLAFDISPAELAQACQTIRNFKMIGVNLSYPHKKAVIPYLDELSPAVQLIGAVNTIVNQQGKLIGYNTDGIGFLKALTKAGLTISEQKITMIGSGGAAMAIIAQAALDGVKEIRVFNRQGPQFAAKGQKLALIAEKTGCKITLTDSAELDALNQSIKESTLLINGTTVGMSPHSDESPLKDFSAITKELYVCDLIYQPRETLFLKNAKKQGAQTMNGLDMLLYQGAAAFKLWTGTEMPVELIAPLIEKI